MAPDMPDLRLSLDLRPSPSTAPLDAAHSGTAAFQPSRRVQILGDSVSAAPAAVVGDGSGDVAAWCTAAVGVPCTLVRQLQGARTAVLGRFGRGGSRASTAPSQAPGLAGAKSPRLTHRDMRTTTAEAEQVDRDEEKAGPAMLCSQGGDSIGAQNVAIDPHGTLVFPDRQA